MSFKEIILYVMGGLGSLGLFAFGGGYLKSQFSKGDRQDKNEVLNSSNTIIEFWKSQAENLKIIGEARDKENAEKYDKMAKDFTTQVTTLTREVGEVRGQFNAESKQKEEYLKILQNRNPEMQKFMETMLAATTQQAEINKGVMELLGDIYKMINDEHNRELHIDATISKDGISTK